MKLVKLGKIEDINIGETVIYHDGLLCVDRTRNTNLSTLADMFLIRSTTLKTFGVDDERATGEFELLQDFEDTPTAYIDKNGCSRERDVRVYSYYARRIKRKEVDYDYIPF